MPHSHPIFQERRHFLTWDSWHSMKYWGWIGFPCPILIIKREVCCHRVPYTCNLNNYIIHIYYRCLQLSDLNNGNSMATTSNISENAVNSLYRNASAFEISDVWDNFNKCYSRRNSVTKIMGQVVNQATECHLRLPYVWFMFRLVWTVS